MSELLESPIVLLGFFSGACYILTFLTRRIVEAAAPSVKPESQQLRAATGTTRQTVVYNTAFARWWNEVILYALSPGLGLLLALLGKSSFPAAIPAEFTTTFSTAVFGVVCGYLSTLLFKIFKKYLMKFAQMDEEEVNKVSLEAEPPPGA